MKGCRSVRDHRQPSTHPVLMARQHCPGGPALLRGPPSLYERHHSSSGDNPGPQKLFRRRQMAHTSPSAQPVTRYLTMSNLLEHGLSLL